MARFNKTLKTIMEAMNSTSKEKTKAYDTPATVLRVDGDTLWVHIDGGVDETPIKRTIDAKVGDVVQVRVGGGRAWATGNASAPPTDDTKAGIALEQTNAVSKTVKTVKTLVDRVTKIAGDTAQYFWHTQQGTDTGVHITEIPKEDFLADPENGGGNLLARSNGIAVRDGLDELATFSASSIRIGKQGEPNVETTPQGTTFNGTDGEVAHILSAGTFYETVENHGTSFDYSNTSVSTGSVNGDPIDFTVYSDVPQGTSISVNVKGSVAMTAIRTFDETKTITYGTSSVQELAELASGNNQVTYSLVYETPNRLYVKADYTGSYTILTGYVDIDSSYQRAIEGAMYSFQKDGKHGSDARGMGAFEHGLDNLVSGNASFASGKDNIVSGDNSCAFGEGNEASGDRTFVFGIGLSRSNPGLTLGRYNLDTGSNALVIGNGTSASPSNAFEVWENGKVNAHGYTIDKTVRGNTHAAALQSWFNSEKDSIVRNSLIPVYSSAYGNGSLCLGYFLTGYDTSPYGGFFVCHYNNARYVGIQNGTFTQYEITKTATSSRKTKENINPMTEDEAKKLYDLNVISFDYKKEYEDGKKNQFGLVAEDCDEVIPYAVYKPDDSEDSIWGIDYVKFVPYLIKNLQLHEQKINELEKEIEFLKHNRRT